MHMHERTRTCYSAISLGPLSAYSERVFYPPFFPFRILTSFLNIRDPLTLDRPQYTQLSVGKSGRDGLKKVEKKSRTRGKKKKKKEKPFLNIDGLITVFSDSAGCVQGSSLR